LEKRIRELEKLNAEYQQSEASLRNLIANSPVVLWTTDEYCNTTFISSNVEHVYGYTPEEILEAGDRLWFGRIHTDDIGKVKAAFSELIKNGGKFDLEYRIRKKNGEWIWIHDRVTRSYEIDGKVCVEGLFFDITIKKNIEEDMRKTKERYEELFENINSGVAVYEAVDNGKDFIFKEFNKAGEKIERIDRKDLIGKLVTEVFPGVKDFGIFKVFQRVYRTGEPEYFPENIYQDNRISGTWRENWIYKLSTGEIVAVYNDITRRKIAEETLKKSESKYRRLVESSPDMTYIYNTRKGMVYWSNRVEEILGYNSQDMNTIPFIWYGSIHPDDLPMVDEIIKQACFGEKFDIEYRVKDKNGKWHWLRDRAIHIEKNNGEVIIEGLATDITERKRTEQSLRESEEKKRTYIDNAPEGIFVTDAEGRFLDVNTTAGILTGFTQEELLTMTVRDILPPDSPPEMFEPFDELLDTGKTETEIVIRKKDGSDIYVSLKAVALSNDRYMGFCSDITKRKKSENEIKKLSQFQEMIIDNADVWLDVLDEKSNVTIWNKAAEKISGYTKEEVIGHGKIWEWLYPDDKYREEITDKAAAIIRDGEMVKDFETIIRTKSGENKVISWYSRNLTDEDKNPIGSVDLGIDVTEKKYAEEEKKKLEEELFQAQKMESIGRLAGGIAHDFNNILTGIMGYAELLKMHFPEVDTIEGESAEAILRNAERAADLTRQLLGFARKGKFNPVPLNINKVIKETVRISEKIFEKNIDVIYELDNQAGIIEGDKHQIEQVLTNIFINAKDAMPNGGQLKITTGNVYLDDEFRCMCGHSHPGDYVRIEITDSGIGIPEDIINNIFEPFFTTKGEREGTGLGLAIVYGIIINHHGCITVESTPGEGTKFEIYLPVSKRSVMRKKKETEIKKGKGLVLVVDDEEDVRKLAGKMLRELGYKVITAEDGDTAVDIYEKNKNQIDLIILDIIMPGKSGVETFYMLKEINPEVKVILSSGYSQEGYASEMLNKEAHGFIQKPYKIGELSETVTGTLKGRK